MMTGREIVRLVEDYIGTTDGYLNQFSYSKHDQFYHTYCDLDVDVQSYRSKGHTTRSAFVEILKDSLPAHQAKIIRGVFEKIPPPEQAVSPRDQVRLKAYTELLAVASRLESGGMVAGPVLTHTSELVQQALADAEVLLRSSGPPSAVDRVHTAIHGYLKKLCVDRALTLSKDPSLTEIFGVMRDRFPEFSAAFAHDREAKRVLGSMGQVLDSLNMIRNRGSLAHPNELLLEEAEATLYINMARAALSYIEKKTKK